MMCTAFASCPPFLKSPKSFNTLSQFTNSHVLNRQLMGHTYIWTLSQVHLGFIVTSLTGWPSKPTTVNIVLHSLASELPIWLFILWLWSWETKGRLFNSLLGEEFHIWYQALSGSRDIFSSDRITLLSAETLQVRALGADWLWSFFHFLPFAPAVPASAACRPTII